MNINQPKKKYYTTEEYASKVAFYNNLLALFWQGKLDISYWNKG